MLAALEAVDYVTIFNEATPHALFARSQARPAGQRRRYAPHEIVGHELVESYGGQVKALGHVPGISSTLVLEQLRNSEIQLQQRPYGRLDENRPVSSQLDWRRRDGDAGLAGGAGEVRGSRNRGRAPSADRRRVGRTRAVRSNPRTPPHGTAQGRGLAIRASAEERAI